MGLHHMHSTDADCGVLQQTEQLVVSVCLSVTIYFIIKRNVTVWHPSVRLYLFF